MNIEHRTDKILVRHTICQMFSLCKRITIAHRDKFRVPYFSTYEPSSTDPSGSCIPTNVIRREMEMSANRIRFNAVYS